MVKLVAPDNAQGMLPTDADIESFACKIKVDVIRGDVWDFVDIQAEPFEENFGVEGEPSGAELEAWILFLFENQDAGGEMRSYPLEMQGSGESARSAADDDNVMIHCSLSVGTRPGFKVTFIMLVIFIKGDVGERLIRNELFLFGIFAGEIKVGMPGA